MGTCSIPVVSFGTLLGRCRSCDDGKKRYFLGMSWQYIYARVAYLYDGTEDILFDGRKPRRYTCSAWHVVSCILAVLTEVRHSRVPKAIESQRGRRPNTTLGHWFLNSPATGRSSQLDCSGHGPALRVVDPVTPHELWVRVGMLLELACRACFLQEWNVTLRLEKRKGLQWRLEAS
ncbi:hypothetical protein LZ32DRAFT_328637 [Colletotrichum eremochloae]|nr:hypothetical protein LZ32DRAFT_328637 [Colletotrichum eremochloae]